MKKTNMFFGYITAVLFLAFFAAGCSSREQLGEGKYCYHIFFRQLTSMELTSLPYETDTEEDRTEALVDELWGVFSSAKNIESAVTTVTDAVVLNRVVLENKTLTFYFENSYTNMDSMTEILFRAALVKTFGQLKEVNNVAICVGEQPLVDSIGNPVGKMVDSDFVGIGSNDVNSVQATALSLYFTNESGDRLIRQEMRVAYNSSFSIERFVLESLIEGPKEEGYYATLPSDLKIISVTVKDRVCYVNLDSTFIDAPLNVQPYIPVYSIVNSLMELPSIRKVQILINGSSDVKFRDSISFAEPLDMNLDYVEEK